MKVKVRKIKRQITPKEARQMLTYKLKNNGVLPFITDRPMFSDKKLSIRKCHDTYHIL